MGPGILPEITVGKHNPPCHLQMPNQTLSCKKESISEHDPEAPSSHLKLTVSKWKSILWSVQIWHSCWNSWMSCHPGKRGRPSSVLSAFSSKLSISDCMGVHKCIRYGQLACFGRHYECWKVYKGFRTTYAPLQMTSISGRALCILPGQCKPHTAAITAAWLHSIKVRVLNFPYLQSRSFHL